MLFSVYGLTMWQQLLQAGPLRKGSDLTEEGHGHREASGYLANGLL